MPYVFGDIVMVKIPDPQGVLLDDDHPAMILYGPKGNHAIVIGITGSFELPIGRLTIEMPWKDGGHEVTGLYKPCVMKCWWIHQIDVRSIKYRLGHTPPEMAERASQYAITALKEKEKESTLRTNQNSAWP